METPSRVILVDRTPVRAGKLFAALESWGYQVTLCEHTQAAGSATLAMDFDVGLIDVQHETPSTLPILEKLILESGFEWVALIDPKQPMHLSIRLALGQLFYSVYTSDNLPELLCLLVHIVKRHVIASLSREHAAFQVASKSIISDTPGMRRVIEQIQLLAGIDAPVFITGESGTGKELAARAIHELSPRAKAPFVAVNCGAIPPNLIQSELFGYEKGAFTDAHCRRIGKIEAAAGGTLFLDEISELRYDLQANFLRFIESRSISRVGSHRETPTDIRIISASNGNFPLLLEQGFFRQDLYYRLNVLELSLPPLRERKQDIETLVEQCFKQHEQYRAPGLLGISPQAMTLLREHDWPGNIRELINTVCRAMLMSNTPYIEAEDIPINHSDRPLRSPTLEEIRQQAEHRTIISALKRNRHNISQAAREMGVSRVTLYRLMNKYDIHRIDTHH